jgi:hypothetical protein
LVLLGHRGSLIGIEVEEGGPGWRFDALITHVAVDSAQDRYFRQISSWGGMSHCFLALSPRAAQMSIKTRLRAGALDLCGALVVWLGVVQIEGSFT